MGKTLARKDSIMYLGLVSNGEIRKIKNNNRVWYVLIK